MKKIICSPDSYVQGSGEIKRLAGFYQTLGSKGAYLIVDKFIFDNYQADIESSFRVGNIPFDIHVFGGECSMREIERIISFCRACGLPTTLKELGLENVRDDRLMLAAEASCAENDTMTNMPFQVEPADVLAAMKSADRLAYR